MAKEVTFFNMTIYIYIYMYDYIFLFRKYIFVRVPGKISILLTITYGKNSEKGQIRHISSKSIFFFLGFSDIPIDLLKLLYFNSTHMSQL